MECGSCSHVTTCLYPIMFIKDPLGNFVALIKKLPCNQLSMYNIVCIIPYEHQAVGFSVYLSGFRSALMRK